MLLRHHVLSGTGAASHKVNKMSEYIPGPYNRVNTAAQSCRKIANRLAQLVINAEHGETGDYEIAQCAALLVQHAQWASDEAERNLNNA